jgi:uncharacterized protein
VENCPPTSIVDGVWVIPKKSLIFQGMEKVNVIDNKTNDRFEAHVDGDVAYLDYKIRNNEMHILHTFVPEELRGRQIADQLAAYALDHARNANMQVNIRCAFVSVFVKRNKAYEHLQSRIGKGE